MARQQYQDDEDLPLPGEEGSEQESGFPSEPAPEVPGDEVETGPEDRGGAGDVVVPEVDEEDTVGGLGSTAGEVGEHEPAPVSLEESSIYTPFSEASNVFNPRDPSAGFSRRLRGLGGVGDITNMYTESQDTPQTGALIQELLRILDNGTA